MAGFSISDIINIASRAAEITWVVWVSVMIIIIWNKLTDIENMVLQMWYDKENEDQEDDQMQ